jgi:hypothetical protein
VAGIGEALESSLASANELTRSLFGDANWTPSQVAEFVNSTRNVTIATTNSSGQPHAAVVIGGCLGDDIYFTVTPESTLARNLGTNDRLAFSVAEGTNAVMGQGRGVVVGRSLEQAGLVGELSNASRAGRFTPEGWDGLLYRIDIRRIFAS